MATKGRLKLRHLLNTQGTFVIALLLIFGVILMAQAILYYWRVRAWHAQRFGADVMDGVTRDVARDFVVFLTITTVVFLAAVVLHRGFAAQVRRLLDQAEAVAGGEPNRNVEVAGPAELQELAGTINRMAEEVRVRDQEACTISHDLRAPLTIIHGHAQLIQRAADRPDLVLRSAEAIISGTRSMNVMIQDLVDAARLESGQLLLQRSPWDLRLFVLDLMERLTGIMEVDRIRVEAREGLPLVMVDGNRLERVLMNLLANALKYSDPGSRVTVTVTEDDGEVVTSVIDQGVGIAPEDLPQLFQRFRRTRRTREDREGLGLGLFISRGLVEAHGGRIWAESEPGKGSTFSFALPVMGEGENG